MPDQLAQAQTILDANAVLLGTAKALGWKVPLAAAGLLFVRLLFGKRTY